jgi:HPt (histidine-containing phosphotransfer) domain-containing protein
LYNEKPEHLFPMGSETLPKQFIFNEKLDKDTLYGLYTDDFLYIEEIFTTTLQHYDADFGAVQLAAENGNIEDLRRAIHKIKPTFGFVGLPQTQAQCKKFEDECAGVTSVTDITKDYTYIKNVLLEARDIIQSEYLRLKAFNANPS